MNIIKSYETRASFDTDLASTSEGALGYTLNNPTEVSVSIVCHIKDTNETIILGTNIFLEEKSIGPGDIVLYDSVDKNFVGVAEKLLGNSTSIKQYRYIPSVIPSRYIHCGRCVTRRGSLCRIGGTPVTKTWDGSAEGAPWDVVTGLTAYGSCQWADGGGSWYAGANLKLLESNYPNGSYYYLPITRANWNAAVQAKEETITGSYSEGSRTYTLADYNWDYDTWFRKTIKFKYPASSGAMTDSNGRENTRKIVAWLANTPGGSASNAVPETDTKYAAGYCWNYSVEGVPGLGVHQWYLGTLRDMVDVQTLRYLFGVTYCWSSTQCSAVYSWYVCSEGLVSSNRRYRSGWVVPLIDLYFKN